jgi:hypothetical protein
MAPEVILAGDQDVFVEYDGRLDTNFDLTKNLVITFVTFKTPFIDLFGIF